MEPELHHQPIRYHEIDLLRFIAAMSVVLFHFTFRGYYADHASPVAYAGIEAVSKYGYLGVELFFIISGYVVLMSAQGKTLSQFFISRVKRLYPAYWVACTLTFVVVRLWGPTTSSPFWSPMMAAPVKRYLASMTMLQGFCGIRDLDGVYWTLTYEISFYFLISLLIAFGWIKKHLVPFLALWLTYCALIGPVETPIPFVILLLPSQAPFFVAGMVLYLLQTKQAAAWKLYLLLLSSYGLCLRSARAGMKLTVLYYHQPFSLPVVCAVVTGCFVVFLMIVNSKRRLGPAKWLTWAGALTYPVYLLHHNMGYVVLQQLGSKVDKYFLLASMLAMVLLLSYLMHVWIERRYISMLGKNLQQLLEKA
ncbi:acyltransferase family protein [Hymenobacter arizonensis]|uniref:Peptidoglycan/LPS O-acetylase OafA/YrhL, contains acyltransferase and SGNH-hydrolase domains n=1 Tax=Hymenobacter arizonensis TaxID=1227077 RepID=A0A1I6BRW7_HYMAR|nr:acyltransferase [Hymenobacter arizonensis]SFQ83671.1 Peptidoglycan/LPS O-acetylase OafA/YrhL, contains acyltransferase and SGNH-hydrolase domains [Hymenobacter arizonensis]